MYYNICKAKGKQKKRGGQIRGANEAITLKGGETKVKSVLKPEAPQILSEGIKDRGLKIKYLAGKVGVNPSYFGQMLKGNRALSTDVAIQTARLVGVSLEDILKIFGDEA